MRWCREGGDLTSQVGSDWVGSGRAGGFVGSGWVGSGCWRRRAGVRGEGPDNQQRGEGVGSGRVGLGQVVGLGWVGSGWPGSGQGVGSDE